MGTARAAQRSDSASAAASAQHARCGGASPCSPAISACRRSASVDRPSARRRPHSRSQVPAQLPGRSPGARPAARAAHHENHVGPGVLPKLVRVLPLLQRQHKAAHVRVWWGRPGVGSAGSGVAARAQRCVSCCRHCHTRMADTSRNRNSSQHTTARPPAAHRPPDEAGGVEVEGQDGVALEQPAKHAGQARGGGDLRHQVVLDEAARWRWRREGRAAGAQRVRGPRPARAQPSPWRRAAAQHARG